MDPLVFDGVWCDLPQPVYTSDNHSGTELRFKHRKIQRAIRLLRPVGIQSMKRLPDRSEQVSEGTPSLCENISIGAAANYFHHRLASSLRRKVQPLQQWAPLFAFFFPLPTGNPLSRNV